MRRVLFLLPALAALLLGAAQQPRGLTGVAPGLWEVSRSATGENARRVCLRQVAALAGYEHHGEGCRLSVLAEGSGYLLTYNSCPRGDFARSELRVTTPRSISMRTQGLHGGAPFDYRLYARRVGDCSGPLGRR